MKTNLYLVLLLVGMSCANASVTTNLQTISAKEIERQPAEELNSLIAKSPKETVFVVTAVVFLNENVTDYYKWFYDSEKKKLVLMQRTTLKTIGEDYNWRIWHDVSPGEFADRLPYGKDNIRTTASKYGKAVETFPLEYADDPEVTKWP